MVNLFGSPNGTASDNRTDLIRLSDPQYVNAHNTHYLKRQNKPTIVDPSLSINLSTDRHIQTINGASDSNSPVAIRSNKNKLFNNNQKATLSDVYCPHEAIGYKDCSELKDTKKKSLLLNKPQKGLKDSTRYSFQVDYRGRNMSLDPDD